jgi:AcrR family transcriptional regulator
MVVTTSEGTRERLISAAMHLFAEHGYAGTTIGQIESEAGLAPRSGALYQYFESKRDLLDAAVARHAESLDQMQGITDLMPLGDLRAELTLMARWNLQDLRRRHDLYRFIRREGDRFPELLATVYEKIGREPLQRSADYLRERFREAGAEEPDAEALVIVLVQTMSTYVSHIDVYGAPPLDVDEERFVTAWVDVCMAYARERGLA